MLRQAATRRCTVGFRAWAAPRGSTQIRAVPGARRRKPRSSSRELPETRYQPPSASQPRPVRGAAPPTWAHGPRPSAAVFDEAIGFRDTVLLTSSRIGGSQEECRASSGAVLSGCWRPVQSRDSAEDRILEYGHAASLHRLHRAVRGCRWDDARASYDPQDDTGVHCRGFPVTGAR